MYSNMAKSYHLCQLPTTVKDALNELERMDSRLNDTIVATLCVSGGTQSRNSSLSQPPIFNRDFHNVSTSSHSSTIGNTTCGL